MEEIIDLTIEEVAEYLCIDYVDSAVSSQIARHIATAHRYLCGAVGDDYPRNDPRVREIALMIIDDLWENRGISNTSGNTRKLINDLELQLKLEMRRKKDELSAKNAVSD